MEQDKWNLLSFLSSFSSIGVDAKQENITQLSLIFSRVEMKQNKELFSQLSLKPLDWKCYKAKEFLDKMFCVLSNITHI